MSQISRIRSEGPKEEGGRGVDAESAGASRSSEITRRPRRRRWRRPSRSPAKFDRPLPVHRLALMSETYFANINDNHLDGFSSDLRKDILSADHYYDDF